MTRYHYKATFSNGETIERMTGANYGKAWAVIVDGKIVASGFAVRCKSLDYTFWAPQSIVEVINPEKTVIK